ncbi:hypothetical protein [Azohydromonas sediminis]|uniref:hypothetical protein n=1 Tax=Azohydromonas sediminis TaxID=2259674 RepID=UPI003AF35006
MRLAAAKHLAEHGGFDGTLVRIFQPAEEGGGAEYWLLLARRFLPAADARATG